MGGMIGLNKFLWLLALLKFSLPFFLQNSVYEPHRDEFLYLAEGAHLSFGFMEVPPMLSVFAWLTQLLGNHIFWIKCWPSLFGALNLVLVGRLVISEGGKHFALFLLFCCFFFTSFLRIHFLFQPNSLEVFFYSVVGFGLIRHIQTSSNRWLYFTAMGAGFGLLSKYSIAFYLISLVPALLLTKHRTLFLNRHSYYAAGLAFLIFLPNLLWQNLHHFPVLYHMKELTKTQLQYVPHSDFIKSQFLMFLPGVYVWIAGLAYLIFNQKGRNYIFLCWAFLGVMALLLWFHGKNYYSVGLYPILFGFGAVAIERFLVGSRYFLRYLLSAFTVLLGIYFVTVALPVMPPENLAAYYAKTHAGEKGILRWEDLKDHALPQDFADMLGWEEMASKAALAYHSLDSAEQKNAIIFCDNYGMAGALNYYRKKYNLPEAYSDNASFLYWIPDTVQYDHIVLLTDDPDEMKHDFIKDFKDARLIDSVNNRFAVEYGSLIILLKGANDHFRHFFSEKLNEDRQKTSPH